MFLFILLMAAVPLLLGLAWNNIKYNTYPEAFCFRYMSGLFTMYALFEIVSAPMCFLKTSFTLVCQVYSVLLAIGCVISVFLYKKNNKSVFKINKMTKPKINRWEIIYLVMFLALFAYQIYRAYTIDIAWRIDDDATYLAYANSAVSHDSMYLISASKGVAIGLNHVRSLQGSLLFISYLSKITGISVAIMAHTVLAVYLLICANIANFLFARRICPDFEKSMMFMIVLNILYIYGYYSDYSMTFRLLGPIWQGKAILAVVLTPFLWIMLMDILQRDFSVYSGLFLIMISTAAMSMSMAGAILMASTLVVLTPIFAVKNKMKKLLLYIPIGGFVPGIIAMAYLVMEYHA